MARRRSEEPSEEALIRGSIEQDPRVWMVVEDLIREGKFDDVWTDRAKAQGWTPPVSEFEILRMAVDAGEEDPAVLERRRRFA